jgi:ferredoxin
MTHKISVIEEECIGCGACTAVSDNFELNDENIAMVKNPTVEDSDLESNKAAADACPKQCIKIE